MKSIVVELGRPGKRRLMRLIRKTKDAGERTRARIVLAYAHGQGTEQIAEMVLYDPSAVRKVRARYLLEGEDAIRDGRVDNGQAKVDEDMLEALRLALTKTPGDWGYARPSWTQELLSLALEQMTAVKVSASTVCRMLPQIGARLGSAKPIVLCPWKKARRTRTLRQIQAMVDNLPDNEVAVYEDEVDIDLNPRIGPDWMLPGTQRQVVTPGKNQKHYLAGALNAKTGQIHWVGNGRKNGYLFGLLLHALDAAYPKAKRIHVILDNYVIHKTKVILKALAKEFGGRIVLHFLPPYCPDHNRIERLWKQMHANVTRNHRCKTLKELLRNVFWYLENAAPFPGNAISTLLKAA